MSEYCILCAKDDKQLRWGCYGFPAWREVSTSSLCVRGQVFACPDHRDRVQERCEEKLGKKFPRITGGPNEASS